MNEYFPLLLIGAIIGVISVIFIVAYAMIKDKKKVIGFDRYMKDSELVKRLLRYARPHIGSFILVLVLMLFSIAYDIVAPLLVGYIEEMIKADFELKKLFTLVIVYASILVVSLVSSYFQAIILQTTGQRIVSKLREDLFSHIEGLSHNQLNNTHVGTLVTRVVNDTNGISHMFTNIVVNLVKNVFVILGVLVAMLCLNYMLTLMVLCFIPFVVLFTIIFRKFSRKAHRSVKEKTTDLNIFLSENLSGMKIIQIFNREERKQQEFDKKNQALGKAKNQQIFTFGIFRPLVYMLYISSILCLLYLGGRGYIKNTEFLGQAISSGTVVSFYMFINKFFNPIQSLAEQFNWLQNAFASAEKIFTVLDIKPEIVDSEDAIEIDKIEGNIEFKDVWFSYIPNEWVLKAFCSQLNCSARL